MAQAQGRPWPRLVAMSRSGRFVALRGPGAIELVDALGTAPRTPIACAELTDFACVGAMLWLLEGRRIRRLALESGRPIEPAIELAQPGVALSSAVGDTEDRAYKNVATKLEAVAAATGVHLYVIDRQYVIRAAAAASCRTGRVMNSAARNVAASTTAVRPAPHHKRLVRRSRRRSKYAAGASTPSASTISGSVSDAWIGA